MRTVDEHTITDAVLGATSESADPRLREVMTSLVRHLHDFAREIQLTEDEWLRGIAFLTDAGHITDANRQEFILLSDVLGLSMLVTAQNHAKPAGATESTVLGPFFVQWASKKTVYSPELAEIGNPSFFDRELDALVHSLRTGAPIVVPATQALNISTLIEALFTSSARSGAKVAL